MRCVECVHYVPRNYYEGTCVKNPPVAVVQMQSREYVMEHLVSTNENGDATYGTGRLKTFFVRPDVLAQDVSGCCVLKEQNHDNEPTPSNDDDDDDDDESESSVLYFLG